MLVPERSPVCPRALTLKELRALPFGTSVIQFFWGTQTANPHRVRAIYRRMRKTSAGLYVVLEVDNPTYGKREDVLPPEDLGLAPYPPGTPAGQETYLGWNPCNIIVLPKDVRALPSGRTPQDRFRRERR